MRMLRMSSLYCIMKEGHKKEDFIIDAAVCNNDPKVA